MNKVWPFYKKFIFLFVGFYSFLYVNSIQFISSFAFVPLWEKLVPPFAKLMGAEEPVKNIVTGSGDTSFDFYLIFLLGVIAVLFTLLLTVIDRKRVNYNTLFKWLLIFIRYYLAYQMINYGFAKIFYLQFGSPGILGLETSLGDMSPMGLLWTFMGFSKGYTMFTGFLELFGGLFLLNRRTMVLGSLLTFGVMLNVMMMNYFYDVPVKLLSTHMVMLSLVLIAYHLKPLFTIFFKGESAHLNKLTDVVPEKWQKVKTIIKWILIIGYLGYGVFTSLEGQKEYGHLSEKGPMEGSYKVEEFKMFTNGEEQTNIPDTLKWETVHYMVFQSPIFKIERKHIETGTWSGWKKMYIDSVDNAFTVQFKRNTDYQKLYPRLEGDSTLYLNGVVFEDSLSIKMKKIKPEDYLLMSRDFNWVQEYPFNR